MVDENCCRGDDIYEDEDVDDDGDDTYHEDDDASIRYSCIPHMTINDDDTA